jgi:hypothetical protein
MDGEHWFDAFNTAVIHTSPRRSILRAAVALSASSILGMGAGSGAAKKKRRNAKKRKKKSARCGHAECAAHFTGNDLDYCQVKCGRCRIREKFCVIESHSHGDHRDWHATCCYADEKCCGTECCGPDETCCDTKDGKQCVRGSVTCCPSDSTLGYCLPGETCCPGIGCVTGSCGQSCPDGLQYCDGSCRECCPRCPVNFECIDGTCQCGSGKKLCAGDCIRDIDCCDDTDCPLGSGRICLRSGGNAGQCRCPSGTTDPGYPGACRPN